MQLDGVANLNFQAHLISGLFCDFVLNIKNRWIFSYMNFSVFIKQRALSSTSTSYAQKKKSSMKAQHFPIFRAKLNSQGNLGHYSTFKENNHLETISFLEFVGELHIITLKRVHKQAHHWLISSLETYATCPTKRCHMLGYF